MKAHLARHWKKYAPIIVAAASAYAATKGVPPETTEQFLRGVCAALGC